MIHCKKKNIIPDNTFLHIERCIIHKCNGKLVAYSKQGKITNVSQIQLLNSIDIPENTIIDGDLFIKKILI